MTGTANDMKNETPPDLLRIRAEIDAREEGVARAVAARLSRGNIRLQQGRFTSLAQFEKERARLGAHTTEVAEQVIVRSQRLHAPIYPGRTTLEQFEQERARLATMRFDI